MLDPDSTSAPVSSMPPPVTPTTLVRRECHIALWRRRPFAEGEEVFVTNHADGVLYFGIVVEVRSEHREYVSPLCQYVFSIRLANSLFIADFISTAIALFNPNFLKQRKKQILH